MLDFLQETLLYIEEQHNWLAYIQSAIAEKEQNYKLLHTKITCKIAEELNKQELTKFNTEAAVVKREWEDFDGEVTYCNIQDTFGSLNETREYDVITEGNFSHNNSQSTNHDEVIPNATNEKHEASNSNQSTTCATVTNCNVLSHEFDSNEMNTAKFSNVVEYTHENFTPNVFPAHSVPRKLSNNLKRPYTSHTCTHCGRKFQQNFQLIAHECIHTAEKPFKCLICKKSFTMKHALLKHMRMHTGEKSFSCYLCNKSFFNKGTLTIHMRIHTGEKPYICSYCNKSFRQKMTLNKHVLTHTGEKPYSCSHCNKSFARNDALKRHVKTHTFNT